MQSQQVSTVVGVFDERTKADAAISELLEAGFPSNQIGVAMRFDKSLGEEQTQHDAGSHAGSGAVTGAVAGLGLGALAGLGVISGVVPVIGPAIAAGTLGVILSNAAAGAGVVGLVGTLIGAGIHDEDAHYYQSEFEAGRTIVTVHAKDRCPEASSILRSFGAYDMSVRDTVTSGSLGS